MKNLFILLFVFSSTAIFAQDCHKELEDLTTRITTNRVVYTSLSDELGSTLLEKLKNDDVAHSELFKSAQMVTEAFIKRHTELQEKILKMKKECK